MFPDSLSRSSHPDVALILSSFDEDVVSTLKEFRAQGDVIIAQRLDKTEKPDMPSAAIQTGMVDYVLSSEPIPRQPEEIAEDFRRSSAGSLLNHGLIT